MNGTTKLTLLAFTAVLLLAPLATTALRWAGKAQRLVHSLRRYPLERDELRGASDAQTPHIDRIANEGCGSRTCSARPRCARPAGPRS